MSRRPNQMRATTIQRYPTWAPGSVVISQGSTRVLCTASVDDQVPSFLRDPATGQPTSGWITAEYAMLPASTPQRKERGPDSRSTEIKRLIGRCLRAAVQMDRMPGITIRCDCDVLMADGGTRTCSITGAFVALQLAVIWARQQGLMRHNPIRGPVAAVSVGIVDGTSLLDLDYDLDVRAQVDMNVAMNHKGQFIEVQGTAEASPFSKTRLDELLKLAATGIRRLIRIQRAALRQAR